MFNFRPPQFGQLRGSTNGHYLINRGSAPKVLESTVTSEVKVVVPQQLANGGGHCSCQEKPTIHIKETNIVPSIDSAKQHSMEQILGRLKGKGKKKYGGAIVKA